MMEHLRLPKIDRIVFEHTPLVLAVCQIRFAPVLSIGDAAQVAPFQRALIDQYPILDPFGEVEIRVEGLPAQAHIERGTPAHRWKFTDLEDTWTVVLALDFLTLETRRYESFEEFLERLRQLLVAFGKVFPMVTAKRIGLRYINEIRADTADWRDIVRAELLGPLAEPALAEHVEQAIQQITLKFGDGDEGINFRHGILKGTTIQSRSGDEPPTSRFYLLDYDAYKEYSRRGSSLVEPESVCQRVEDHHEAISQLFRWSITDEYTSSLGVR